MTVRADPLTLEERLRDIQAITDAALSHLDDRDFLAQLLARTRDILGADTAAVLLLDDSSEQLIATAAAGLEEEVRQGVLIPVGQGFAGRIAAEGRPVILDRVDHTTVLNPILWSKGIQSMMGVPLVAGGRVIGVLHVGSLDHREFTSQDTELLQMAADRAAVAVQSMMAAPARTASSLPMTSIVADRLCGSIPITTALMRTSTDSPATFRRGRATLLRAARGLGPCRHRGLAFRRRASS